MHPAILFYLFHFLWRGANGIKAKPSFSAVYYFHETLMVLHVALYSTQRFYFGQILINSLGYYLLNILVSRPSPAWLRKSKPHRSSLLIDFSLIQCYYLLLVMFRLNYDSLTKWNEMVWYFEIAQNTICVDAYMSLFFAAYPCLA